MSSHGHGEPDTTSKTTTTTTVTKHVIVKPVTEERMTIIVTGGSSQHGSGSITLGSGGAGGLQLGGGGSTTIVTGSGGSTGTTTTKATSRKIPGTELSTEVWYGIELQNGGRLTWSDTKVDGMYNHAQIVYSTALPDYALGGAKFTSAQWKLVESEFTASTGTAYYQFVNRAQPNAVLTFSGASPGGKYVVLFLDHASNADYLKGGHLRDTCLWKIEAQPGGTATGYYSFYNKKFPENGIVTWDSTAVDTGKKYVQLYETGYPSSYNYHGDYLWKFMEVPDDSKLATIIPGTKLSPQDWYTIELKSGGLLTYSDLQVERKFNHAQVVYYAGATEYVAGARLERDTHWKILPSEEAGHVTFVNRSKPDAVLTFSGDSAGGKYVVLYMDHASDADYLKGGKFRSDCLWKIESEASEPHGYRFYNKSFPEAGVLTYCAETVAEGKKYCQVYSTGYRVNYVGYPNYIWKFTKVD